MAYTKSRADWVDGEAGGTRIDAANLDTIEQGIYDAAATADAAIPKTLIDAKGDLIVGTAPDTAGRLAVGTDGQILTADAASPGGVKWAASGGGSDPWTYYVASAETTNNTTTHVNAAGLSIPSGLTAGTYLIDAFVVSKISDSGASHNYRLTKPTGGLMNTLARGARGAVEVWHYASTAAGGDLTVSLNAHPNSTWGAPAAEFKATLYVASGSTSTAINLTFAPGTAGVTMTIMLGSYVAIRRIA